MMREEAKDFILRTFDLKIGDQWVSKTPGDSGDPVTVIGTCVGELYDFDSGVIYVHLKPGEVYYCSECGGMITSLFDFFARYVPAARWQPERSGS